MYRWQCILAFPVYSESLNVNEVCGWALVDMLGGTVPQYDHTGKIVGNLKVKLPFGSKVGM